MKLTSRLCSGAAMALCLSATSAFADTLLVTNFDAVGEGSLQAALDAAGASPEPSVIMITETAATLSTPQGLRYEGTSALSIYGNAITITSPENVTLFSVLDAREVVLVDMTFEGLGGWSIEARGDVDGPAGKGIFMDVADDATGTVGLRLVNVTVSGTAGHGIHVSDCTLADACGAGGGGAGDGSDASLVIELSNVTIASAGQGSFDADGLRVDERGPGDITLTGMQVVVTGVGADGIELDEGQEGDVVVDLIHGIFIENGSYCDPALLQPFMPENDARDYPTGVMSTDAIPGPVTGSPDDGCFEREVDLYDDGSVEEYAFAIDVDDGFDIDEAGPGSIIATFSVGQMIGNFDEGYDFDEEGSGDIDTVFTGIIGNGNLDDAIKLSEAGPGSVYLTATAVEASSNGGVGIVAEEENGGDLMVTLIGVATAGNDGGELGIEAVQDDEGEGNIYVIDTEIADGIETDGATLDAD